MLTKVSINDPLSTQVVKITLANRIYASGVVLAGGQYILTAAHLFTSNFALSDLTITDAMGKRVGMAQAIDIHPGWDNNRSSYNHDLALIKLTHSTLLSNQGYEVYRGSSEIGQTFMRVGYAGTELVKGENTYDAYTDMLNTKDGSRIRLNTQLLYDYDDGTPAHDALGLLFNVNNLGLGSSESISQPGLSGAPTFINNQIAGIGSYIFRSDLSDVNSVIDSSFGEMGSDMRVSAQADWIDYVTKGNPVYVEPKVKSEVMTKVPEPNYGSVVNYFLASFSEPLKQDISFDYRTLDGTAKAGLDYIATQGHIDMRIGQDHVAIPVTILGDKLAEGDETFQLEVRFGAITLVAVRTIVDNDVL
jgi:hypothetical protein